MSANDDARKLHNKAESRISNRRRAQQISVIESKLPTDEQEEANPEQSLDIAMIQTYSDGTTGYWAEDNVLYQYQDGRMEVHQTGSDNTPYRELINSGQFGNETEMSDEELRDWIAKTNMLFSKIQSGTIGKL